MEFRFPPEDPHGVVPQPNVYHEWMQRAPVKRGRLVFNGPGTNKKSGLFGAHVSGGRIDSLSYIPAPRLLLPDVSGICYYGIDGIINTKRIEDLTSFIFEDEQVGARTKTGLILPSENPFDLTDEVQRDISNIVLHYAQKRLQLSIPDQHQLPLRSYPD